MIDYIDGNKFLEFVKTFGTSNGYKEILFTSNNSYQSAFNKAVMNPITKFILITHHSDDPVTEEMFKRKPHNIKYWFGRNCEYSHPDLIPIPIGLQNEYGYNGADMKQQYFAENCKRWQNVKKRTDVVYCNWRNWVNPIRSTIIPIFDEIGIKYIWEDNVPNTEYWNRLASFQFIVSPPGNHRGRALTADCHKTWEAIYMGCTPIVIDSPMYDEYPELPIIKVKNYRDLTPKILESSLNKQYNYEKSTMTYWKNRILEIYKNL